MKNDNLENKRYKHSTPQKAAALVEMNILDKHDIHKETACTYCACINLPRLPGRPQSSSTEFTLALHHSTHPRRDANQNLTRL